MEDVKMEGEEQGTQLRTRSARLKAANSSPNAKSGGGDASPLIDEGEEKTSGSRRISSRKSLTNGLGISDVGESAKLPNTGETSKSEVVSGIYDLEMESADLEGDADEDEKDVPIRAEDKKKLSIVLRAFVPDLLRLRIQTQQQQQSAASTSNLSSPQLQDDPRKRGAERRAARASDVTLDDLLSQPKLGIRQLRDHLIKLRAPLITPTALRAHLSGSHILPSRDTLEDDRTKLTAISTCLTLVEEIAKRNQRQTADEMTNIDGIGRMGEYALQMRLPGGDYFTNAVSMSAKEASEIDPAYARIVDFSASRLAPRSHAVPTLGDRLYDALRTDKVQITHPILGMPVRYRREDEEVIKPVSHLYYGSWSSFAPTYDSFDGQMSHKASNALWRAKREEAIEMRRMAVRKPTLYVAEAREQLEDMMDDIDTDLDADLILDGYDNLPDLDWKQSQADTIDEILTQNATLLTCLQDLQEQRWRQLMAKSVANSRRGYEEALAKPDANEQAIARSLLASLTSLLSAQPRINGEHKDNHEAIENDHIIPSTGTLQSLSSSAAIDPALMGEKAEQGIWGTLDKTTFGPEATRRQALSRSMVSARPVAAVRDNETLRLSKETEEKAISQTMSLGATVLGANRDRGKGLLDRFASSRAYALEDHPHDRKPPVPPAPTARPPPPTPPVGARPPIPGPHQNIVSGRPPFQSPRQGISQFHPHQSRSGYPPVSSGQIPFGRPSPLASNGSGVRPPSHQAMTATATGSPGYR